MFLTVPGAKKSKIKVPADSWAGGALFLVADDRFLAVSSRGGKRAG